MTTLTTVLQAWAESEAYKHPQAHTTALRLAALLRDRHHLIALLLEAEPTACMQVHLSRADAAHTHTIPLRGMPGTLLAHAAQRFPGLALQGAPSWFFIAVARAASAPWTIIDGLHRSSAWIHGSGVTMPGYLICTTMPVGLVEER